MNKKRSLVIEEAENINEFDRAYKEDKRIRGIIYKEDKKWNKAKGFPPLIGFKDEVLFCENVRRTIYDQVIDYIKEVHPEHIPYVVEEVIPYIFLNENRCSWWISAQRLSPLEFLQDVSRRINIEVRTKMLGNR